MIRASRFLVLSFTLAVLALGAAQASGHINPGHCKPCLPAPAGCTFADYCETYRCFYTCMAADGSTYTYITPRTGRHN